MEGMQKPLGLQLIKYPSLESEENKSQEIPDYSLASIVDWGILGSLEPQRNLMGAACYAPESLGVLRRAQEISSVWIP